MDPTLDPSDLRVKIIDTAKILSQQSPFNELHIETYTSIKSMDESKQQVYRELLQEMIEDDGSHGVVGVYAMGNITSRSKNSLILIGDLDIVINTSSDMVQVLEYHAEDSSLQFLKQLVIQLGEVFIFGSGKGLIETLGELEYDQRSDNIVFYHKEIDLDHLDTIVEKYQFVDISDNEQSDYSKEEMQAFGMLMWEYSPESVETLNVPHIVMINDKKEVMGGARVNEIAGGYGVVGGVRTMKAFRQQGVGTAVSQLITAKIREMGLHPVLETDDENIPAIRIYEKLGYKRVGETVFLDFGTGLIEKIRGDRDY